MVLFYNWFINGTIYFFVTSFHDYETITSVLSKVPLHMWRVGHEQLLSIPTETRTKGIGQMKSHLQIWTGEQCGSSRNLRKQRDTLLPLEWFKRMPPCTFDSRVPSEHPLISKFQWLISSDPFLHSPHSSFSFLFFWLLLSFSIFSIKPSW